MKYRQRRPDMARAHVQLPIDLIRGVDVIAEREGVSRAMIMARLVREGLQRDLLMAEASVAREAQV